MVTRTLSLLVAGLLVIACTAANSDPCAPTAAVGAATEVDPISASCRLFVETQIALQRATVRGSSAAPASDLEFFRDAHLEAVKVLHAGDALALCRVQIGQVIAPAVHALIVLGRVDGQYWRVGGCFKLPQEWPDSVAQGFSTYLDPKRLEWDALHTSSGQPIDDIDRTFQLLAQEGRYAVAFVGGRSIAAHAVPGDAVLPLGLIRDKWSLVVFCARNGKDWVITDRWVVDDQLWG